MLVQIIVKPGDYIYSIDKYKNIKKYKVEYVKLYSDSIMLYYDENDNVICSQLDITCKNIVNDKLFSWSEYLLEPLYKNVNQN